MPARLPRDIGYSFQNATTAIDGGRMDRFDLSPGANEHRNYLAYPRALASDIPDDWRFAETFARADHMFSSLIGPSVPNHLYGAGAQSGGTLYACSSVWPFIEQRYALAALTDRDARTDSLMAAFGAMPSPAPPGILPAGNGP